MQTLYRAALLLVAFTILVSCPSAFSEVGIKDAKPISVILEPGLKPSGTIYTLEGNKVRSEKLLNELGGLLLSRGRNNPVVVLVDERMTISELWNIKGLIDKAGFMNDRYFSFLDHDGMMSEIKFASRAVPFSLDP